MTRGSNSATNSIGKTIEMIRFSRLLEPRASFGRLVRLKRDSKKPPIVYIMRMARINVYVPDELADEVRAAGLNVSSLTQQALRRALASARTDEWLDAVYRLRSTGISHEDVSSAVGEAKDEWDGADA